MSIGLGIFVKTPALSPVKTRLASDVGQLRAEAFYLSSAEAVASVAQQLPPRMELRTYWAVAEKQALDGAAWIDLPRLPQGIGSLGERMARVYRLLLSQHHGALLVGADAPQLTQEMLGQAVRWLALPGRRLVIGPARDGGFWLFGGNCLLPDRAWSEPTYSCPETYRQFVAAMRAHGEWLELEALTDVDRGSDLMTVQKQLQQLPAPTDAQLRLSTWLDDWSALGELAP